MHRDHWPAKFALAFFALVIVVADFASPGVSSGALFLVAVLLIFDALNDRSLQAVERQWAEEERVARVAADKAERALEASEVAEGIRERKRAFKAGKNVGFLIASHAHNEDLLKLKDLSPPLREKLQDHQRKMLSDVDELMREFGHLNGPDEA